MKPKLGRKKVPKAEKRIRIACTVAPITVTRLNAKMRDKRLNLGRLLDQMLKQDAETVYITNNRSDNVQF